MARGICEVCHKFGILERWQRGRFSYPHYVHGHCLRLLVRERNESLSEPGDVDSDNHYARQLRRG